MSGKVPARKTRQTPHRSIYILPLNVGDKGVAKIYCCRTRDAEALGACPKRKKIWTYDIKINLFSRGVEKQDFEGLLWGPIN